MTGRRLEAYHRGMKKANQSSLRSLVNIGPKIEKKLQAIGIATADDFMARDPYEVFANLRTTVDPTLCRCALASLVGARLGMRWPEVTRDAAREFEKRYPDITFANKC